MFVVLLVNVLSNVRIWNALHLQRRNLMIFNQVLGANSSSSCSSDFGCDVCGEAKIESDNGLFSTLNESQVRAVRSCLLKTSCVHKSAVELIWGPPGTGKTKTVSVLLFQLLKSNRRTLACAPTNTAIMQVKLSKLTFKLVFELIIMNFLKYRG